MKFVLKTVIYYSSRLPLISPTSSEKKNYKDTKTKLTRKTAALEKHQQQVAVATDPQPTTIIEAQHHRWLYRKLTGKHATATGRATGNWCMQKQIVNKYFPKRCKPRHFVSSCPMKTAQQSLLCESHLNLMHHSMLL